MSERSEDNPSLSARQDQNPRIFVGFLFSERATLASASLENKKACGETPGFCSKYVASLKRDHEIILLSGEQKEPAAKPHP